MKSTEKVREAIDRAEGFADDPDAPGSVKAMAAGIGMFRGQLESLLPANDAELDELLEKGANWLWSLRSDQEVAPVSEVP